MLYFKGTERQIKRELPRFNEKAKQFNETLALNEPRKRKPNQKYNDESDVDSDGEWRPPVAKRSKQTEPTKRVLTEVNF